jgi:hypothetical protein
VKRASRNATAGFFLEGQSGHLALSLSKIEIPTALFVNLP